MSEFTWTLPSLKYRDKMVTTSLKTALTALQMAEEDLRAAIDRLAELEHLHACEQEALSSGMPTPAMWYAATNKATEFLNRFRSE